MYGNLFASDNLGSGTIYENISTTILSYQAFSSIGTPYTTPGVIATEYESGTTSPYYDIFQSKYTNIWHLSGTDNLSTIYGARLTSLYDYQVNMTFANQVFYPTHKIVLTKIAIDANVMADSGELTKYPSYPHTQMFLYNNYSTLINDIGGKFALEQSNNFANTIDCFYARMIQCRINNEDHRFMIHISPLLNQEGVAASPFSARSRIELVLRPGNKSICCTEPPQLKTSFAPTVF
jgi:hypothetical protein